MSSAALDARLLRFRHNPTAEDPSILAAELLEESRAFHALEVLTAGLEARAEDLELLVLGGRAWLMQGDLLRAQNALLQAARVAPEDPRAFRWLSEVLIQRGDPARAKQVLAHGLELLPDDAEMIALRARADAVIEQAEVTLEAFEEPVPHLEERPPAFEDDGEPESGPRAIEFQSLEVAEPRDWAWLWRALFWSSCALACGAFGYSLWTWWGADVRQSEAVTVTETVAETEAETDTETGTATVAETVPAVPEVIVPTEVPVAAAPLPPKTQPVAHPFVGPPAPVAPISAPVDPSAALRRVARLNSRALRLVRSHRYEPAINAATKALEAASALPRSEAAQAMALYVIGRAHLEERRRETASVFLRRAVEVGEAPAAAWFFLGESLAAVNSPAARTAYTRYLSLEPNSRLALRARKAIQ